jgi:hypothetical protein
LPDDTSRPKKLSGRPKKTADEHDKACKPEESESEMSEANLKIARKVILCVGLLVAALLFLFPHWRVSINVGILGENRAFDQEIGRGFIAYPPVQLTGGGAKFVARINYIRQITEVAIALLLTFGLMRALKLKKPAGD